MSTETTNKKIKIDNGTTFGRTYTDKAVDELLKNVGGGGKSVPPALNLSNFETAEVRTTITEEEYNNLKNGLYNSVNYYNEAPEEVYLQSKLFSIYDDKNKSLSCSFSSIKINFTSETDMSLTNVVYQLNIGQKDTSGNYPITIEKLVEIPFGSNSGGSGASLNVVTIDSFNNGDHNQQGFVMPTEDVVLFTDNGLVSLIGCKNVQNGVISYTCLQWVVSVQDGHYKYAGNLYEITAITGGYHIEKTEMGISPEFLPNYSGNDNGKVLSVVNGKTQWTTPADSLTFPTTSPSSRLIPSITTSNEQQNLTIGDGLEIKNGALDIKSNVVKINTYSININKTEISTTAEVGVLSFAESAKTKNTALFNLLAQNENNILNIKVKLNLADGTSFLIFMDYHKASAINFENIQGVVLKGTDAIDTHIFCVDDYRSNQNLQEYYGYLSSVDVIVNYY